MGGFGHSGSKYYAVGCVKRWGPLTSGVFLFAMLLAAPRALADEPAAPPEARCQSLTDAGAGALGGGAAVSETHWQTDWERLCVQTAAPPIGGLNDALADTGCDRNDRRAVEVYVDHDGLETQRSESCDDDFPEGNRGQRYNSCVTDVGTDGGPTVSDSCRGQSREGDQSGWYYSTANDSSSTASVGENGVTVTRARSGSDTTGGVQDSNSDQVSVGPDGVTYTSTADATFSHDPSFDYHCNEEWTVSTADPAATQPVLPSYCTLG
ncbi:MAG: hypothetical protein QOI95_2793 [Acidimicrobiaceae bacterium]|jgi:hypothetical protein